MIKIIILCAVAIQIATSYEFNQNCAKGPSYWCQNVKTANECNAFKHCTQDIWSKHTQYLQKKESVSSVNPSKCLNCLQCIAGDLRRCPIIRDYKDEIAELFSYKLPSETICHLIEQCDKTDKSVENDEQQKTVGTNPIDLLNVESMNDPRFECGLHPRNWCINIDTAKKCNAFNTCLANWAKSNAKYVVKPLPNENDFSDKDVMDQKTCGFCIFVFNKVQAVIQQNSTEANIRSYLESACSILPSKPETESCLSSIERYWPEIYNIVRSNVDPGIICRVIDACHDKHLQQAPAKESTKSEEESKAEWSPIQLNEIKFRIVNPDQAIIKTPLQQHDNLKPLASTLSATNGVGCELCILTMSAVKYFVINKVDNEKILSFIESQLCSRLGSLNDTCVGYFQMEGPELFKLLEQEIISPSFACFKTGLCMKNQIQTAVPFFDLEARSASNCTMCKLVIMEAKSMIANKKNEAQIIEYINHNLCEKIGSQKELCKSLISTYGDWFFQLILHDIQPGQFCQMIGLCPKSNEIIQEKADPTCVLCEFVVSLLTKRINPNSTKDDIQKELDYVCNVAIPKRLRSECISFVDKYGPAIIDIIIQEVTPDNVCELIGLCTAKVTNQEIAPKKNEINYLSTQTCTMCEFLANMLSKIIDKHMNEAAIIQDLEHICNSTMPNSWRNKCDQFVDVYGSQIIHYLLKEESADLICQMVGACHDSGMVEMTKVNKLEYDESSKDIFANVDDVTLKSNSTCVMCEFVVSLLSKLVDKNTTEPEMVKELEFLCNYTMPATWKSQCTVFVDAYGPKIIDYIVQDIDPEAVCSLIDLCPSKTQIRPKTQHRLIGADEQKFYKNLVNHVEPVEKANEIKCVVCQFVVQFLSNQMQIDRTSTVLEIAVKNICQLTPKTYKKHCETMIHEHGDKLVSLIDKHGNSLDVCHSISNCEPSNEKVQEKTDLVDIEPAEPRHLHKENYNELLTDDSSNSNGETLECQLCVYVAQLANHFLKQNKTEAQIVTELELVCNYFPNDLKNQCTLFINEYGPYVIQLIADDIDPNSACQALKLCDGPKAEKKKFASYLIHYKLRP